MGSGPDDTGAPERPDGTRKDTGILTILKEVPSAKNNPRSKTPVKPAPARGGTAGGPAPHGHQGQAGARPAGPAAGHRRALPGRLPRADRLVQSADGDALHTGHRADGGQ